MNTIQSKDGTTLAYDVYGSGPALLLITGATCFRSFEPVLYDATTFAEQFTVYHYDRRGRGDSGNTLPYDPQREVEDIEAMIDAAGGSAFLYGHSSGAILALEAAIQLGEKVKKLVLYDASYVHNQTEQQEFRTLSQGLYTLLDNGNYDEAIRLFLQDIGIPQEVLIDMQQSPQWPIMTALAPTLAYDTQLALNLPPLERASHLTTPTQIIIGENNPESIHEVARQLSGVIANATFIKLADQDHMPDPNVVLPVLSRFLKA